MPKGKSMEMRLQVAKALRLLGEKDQESAFAPNLAVFQTSTLAKRDEMFSGFERLIPDLLFDPSSSIRLSPR
jgi:hypothetical protein